jgi:hypothetical protein
MFADLTDFQNHALTLLNNPSAITFLEEAALQLAERILDDTSVLKEAVFALRSIIERK